MHSLMTILEKQGMGLGWGGHKFSSQPGTWSTSVSIYSIVDLVMVTSGSWNILFVLPQPPEHFETHYKEHFTTLKCLIGSQWHQHSLLKGILWNLGTWSGFKPLPFLTARNQHLPLYNALHGWILPHENSGSILGILLFITSRSLPKYLILLFLLRLVFIVCRSCC